MSDSQTCGINHENEQDSYKKALIQGLAEHGLPDSYLKTVHDWLEPIALSIDKALSEKTTRTNMVLGVQGTQGSGKSTCSDFLKRILETRYKKRVAVLSIDDFYLTRSERQILSKKVHPLLETRGVPGTHDVELAIKTIKHLLELDDNTSTFIPRFDKSVDDRFPEKYWSKIEGSIDLVILEGWCVGLGHQEQADLQTPCNELEKLEDRNGAWRSFVNEQLKRSYQTLFTMINHQLTLRAPSFTCVYQWRLKQEQKLINKLKRDKQKSTTIRTMNENEIKHFISHYERLTEHALKTMPGKSRWCLWLNEDQSIERMTQVQTPE